MKGDLTLFILEALQVGKMAADEIIDELTYRHPTNIYKRMRGVSREFLIPEHKPIFEDRIARIKERQRITKLLSKLKSEGLITREGEALSLTKAGGQKLQRLEERPATIGRMRGAGSQDFKIIIFDIPERQNGKRQWLRTVLKTLEMTMLQESVWAGKAALPEEFFAALRRLGILQYVEIFSVTKSGTLKLVNS